MEASYRVSLSLFAWLVELLLDDSNELARFSSAPAGNSNLRKFYSVTPRAGFSSDRTAVVVS